jgi:DNA helicase-2/ATP-dependent DNA helicase PcrA
MFVCDENALNEEQRDAINDNRNIFLIACPGSGKTRALTYKIAKELTELSSHNKWIIAITYTHRAADEIKERIESLGVDTQQLWIGTIHSFCIEWILKPYGSYHDSLRYGYRVVNSYDSEELISDICRQHSNPSINYYDCGYYFTPQGIVYSCDHNKLASVQQVIAQYHSNLLENNKIDFEQILYLSYQLITSTPSICNILSKLFSYILIDEFQDTKEIQYSIFGSILNAGRGHVKCFIVGDPNQAIYGSLGGYAISLNELNNITGLIFSEKQLNRNYRSSSRVIEHYSNYRVYDSDITPTSNIPDHLSNVTYETSIHKDDLPEYIARLIRFNIEELGISESEICIVAPWWIHLASMTRNLISSLPEYNFNGPGMTPFSRDEDNFWYKVAKLLLTEPSPRLYVRRIRWATEIIRDLEKESVCVQGITPKILLKNINSINLEESDGIRYLQAFFIKIFNLLNIEFRSYPSIQEHHDSFFESAQRRIERIVNENNQYAGTVDDFRKVFKRQSGITVSTIHGVKGAEFDSVISYGLVQGYVPHFSEADPNSAHKLIYVIGSRARKHLHLISELGRGPAWRTNPPTHILEQHPFNYDIL